MSEEEEADRGQCLRDGGLWICSCGLLLKILKISLARLQNKNPKQQKKIPEISQKNYVKIFFSRTYDFFRKFETLQLVKPLLDFFQI